MPRTAIAAAAMLVALLAACGDQQRAPTPTPETVSPDIAEFRYAVVAFDNHAILRDRGGADLLRRGFTVLDADDERLATPAFARTTLWFTFRILRVGGGEAVEMVARDRAGTRRFSVEARRTDEPLSVDADIDALIPYRGDHPRPPPGTMIQL